ncbi:MAG: fumarylacetoacetate hydrolase family protein [Thermoplasmatales archaeon]|nr:MAG: fumarylacetoacetate hydrolase family protein [Thermoplasmatales archaeon]
MAQYIFQNYDKKVNIGKIICLARTYKKHAQEMHATVTEDPILFLKPESSIIFNNESIVLPKMSNCVHHEVELGVVICKTGKNISEKDAMDHVLGYVVALDITARDIQSVAKKSGWPWSIAKGFDTFAPISYVVLKDEVPDLHNLDLKLKVNDKLKQLANTKYMIYSVERIIEFVSKIMTLKKGDLILTGTPEGVGELFEGDVIEAKLGDVCYLKVNVKREQ